MTNPERLRHEQQSSQPSLHEVAQGHGIHEKARELVTSTGFETRYKYQFIPEGNLIESTYFSSELHPTAYRVFSANGDIQATKLRKKDGSVLQEKLITADKSLRYRFLFCDLPYNEFVFSPNGGFSSRIYRIEQDSLKANLVEQAIWHSNGCLTLDKYLPNSLKTLSGQFNHGSELLEWGYKTNQYLSRKLEYKDGGLTVSKYNTYTNKVMHQMTITKDLFVSKDYGFNGVLSDKITITEADGFKWQEFNASSYKNKKLLMKSLTIDNQGIITLLIFNLNQAVVFNQSWQAELC